MTTTITLCLLIRSLVYVLQWWYWFAVGPTGAEGSTATKLTFCPRLLPYVHVMLSFIGESGGLIVVCVFTVLLSTRNVVLLRV